MKLTPETLPDFVNTLGTEPGAADALLAAAQSLSEEAFGKQDMHSFLSTAGSESVQKSIAESGNIDAWLREIFGLTESSRYHMGHVICKHRT